MYGLKEMLQKEQIRLEGILQKTKEQLKDAPEGKLRISKSGKQIQYYLRKDGIGAGTGQYLHNSDGELVHRLAQKSYDEKVLRLAGRRLRQMKYLTEEYQDNELEILYEKEHPERQKLIRPVELTWQQRLCLWMEEKYEGKAFKPGETEIYSERGERVRSKSEKILADYFYRNNICYKYEKPLRLKGYGIVYPDFTFLSKKTGKEIYWEHEGRMDDPVYAKMAVKKIKTYEENGIFVGEGLILTFETETSILSTKDIESKVKRHLCSSI